MADLRVAPHGMCPFFVYAVLKTQASCPQWKCDAGRCKYITASEIASLSADEKSDMMHAEKLMAECRQIARTRGVPDDVQARA